MNHCIEFLIFQTYLIDWSDRHECQLFIDSVTFCKRKPFITGFFKISPCIMCSQINPIHISKGKEMTLGQYATVECRLDAIILVFISSLLLPKPQADVVIIEARPLFMYNEY